MSFIGQAISGYITVTVLNHRRSSGEETVAIEDVSSG